jgi:hypothetical protein
MLDLTENAEFTHSAGSGEAVHDDAAVTPDPVPQRTKAKPKRTRTAKTTATAAMKREAKDFVQFTLEMAASIWSTADPVCAGVLEAQAPAIADKASVIMARYPGIIGKLDMPSMVKDWIDLAAVTLPVLAVVRAHHFGQAVEGEAWPHPESPDGVTPPNGFVYA